MKNRMNNKKNSGFTVVEVLATVAIIVILLSVSAVSVAHHMDMLKITELDNAAREIYMAAENRAVLLSNSRQLKSVLDSTKPLSDTATAALAAVIDDEGASEALYRVASKTDVQLLPHGSIDPSLLNGDFYIVYDASTGSVKEVFYAENEDVMRNFDQFFSSFHPVWEDLGERIKARKFVGWYDGSTANMAGPDDENSPPVPGQPQIIVKTENDEELTVEVTVTLTDETVIETINSATDVEAALIAAGLKVNLGPADGTDGLNLFSTEPNVIARKSNNGWKNNSITFTWVLDSLNPSGDQSLQFQKLKDFSGVAPGEDFMVTASMDTVSGRAIDNSLFERLLPGGDDGDLAYIGKLRHLQNLNAEEGTAHNSGVENVVWAYQTDDIKVSDNEFYGTTSYTFTPIWNTYLAGYNGEGKAIKNLNVNVTSGDAGLFAQTREGGMTFMGVRMVNTTVNATGATGAAGALVGRATGTTNIIDCWVYWEEEVVDRWEGVDSYAITGNIAGGLVGVADGTVINGIVTISHSLAATLIEGTGTATNSAAGGLVGRVSAGTATITHSYADCYLNGAGKVAGLVGDLMGSANLTDCYAAGFIMGAGEVDGKIQAAGLCMGNNGTTTARNVYSAMLVPTGDVDEDGNPICKAPANPLTGKTDETFAEDKKVYYLGEGGMSSSEMKAPETGDDDTFLDGLNGTRTGTNVVFERKSDSTTPYNLLVDLSGENYAYPGLTGLPHYNDWGELEVNDPGTFALVYYEYYGEVDGEDSYGIYGVDINGNPVSSDNMNKKTDSTQVEKYGYALVYFGDSSQTGDIKFDYSYEYNNVKERGTDNGGAQSKDLISVKDLVVNNKIDAFSLLIIDDLVSNNVKCAPDNFYVELKFSSNKYKVDYTFFYNPHFAKTVRASKIVTKTVVDGVETRVEEVKELTYYTKALKALDGSDWAIIRTPGQLENLRRNEDDNKYKPYRSVGYKYFQELNLDLSSGYTPEPIGTSDTDYFTGIYDGDNHTISKLQVHRNSKNNDNCVGLFGYNEGTIQNVKVIYGGVSGHNYLGCIVGYNNGGTVLNCHNGDGNDRGSSITGTDYYIGGIVGYNDRGTVKDCHTHAAKDGLRNVVGRQCVGGIVGKNTADTGDIRATVENCSSYVQVRSSYIGGQYAGGIVGENNGEFAEVSNCKNYGPVEVFTTDDQYVTTYGSYVGGIVGKNTGGTVQVEKDKTVSNSGTITGGKYVGGIVGWNSGTVSGYSNEGTVKAEDNVKAEGVGTEVGGIVGRNEGGKVTGCYNNEDSEVTGYRNVGGIVGYNKATEANNEENPALVKDCHNYAKLTARYDGTDNDGGANVGGVVGLNDGKFAVVSGCSNEVSIYLPDCCYVGGIVGYNIGGSVTGGSTSESISITGKQYVGGIVGYNSGTTGTVQGKSETEHSVNGAEVKSNQQTGVSVGGIVGYNTEGTVKWYDNKGAISGYQVIGGIVGNNLNGGTVTWCDNIDGSVVSGGYDSGGVVGRNEGTVKYCRNTVTVTGGDQSIGGIVGMNNQPGTVEECYNTGAVTGAEFVGGVVGHNGSWGPDYFKKQGAVVENCYNTGPVTANSGSAGGVVGYLGYNTCEVINCYSIGNVTGPQKGGVIGKVDGAAEKCYYLENTSFKGYDTGNDVPNEAESLTERRFGIREFFADSWDFESNAPVWTYRCPITQGPFIDDNYETVDSHYIGHKTWRPILRNLPEEVHKPTDQLAHSGVVYYEESDKGIAILGYDRDGKKIEVGEFTAEENGTDDWSYKMIVLVEDIRDLPEKIMIDGQENTITESSLEDPKLKTKDGKFNVMFYKEYTFSNNEDSVSGSVTLQNSIEKDITLSFSEHFAKSVTVGNTVTEFYIRNCEQLGNLSTKRQYWTVGRTFYQELDLTLESVKVGERSNWSPIGKSNGQHFIATYDGLGHHIDSLQINNSSLDNQGLFGYVGIGGTVRNLTVYGSVTAGFNVGGIAANNYGTVEKCVNNADITATGEQSGAARVGGIVGVNSGSDAYVSNCRNEGKVESTGGGGYVGGIVGVNQKSSHVENCINTGAVSGDGDGEAEEYKMTRLGGIAGSNNNSVVKNCHNAGAVTGENYQYVGGVVGFNSVDATVQNCYNNEDVQGKQYVGGIVGISQTNSVVKGSSNTNSVTGEKWVGGVVGQNTDNSTVEECHNEGEVSGSGESQYVGGVVGQNSFSSTVQNCYNNEDVQGKQYVGGIVGISQTDSVVKGSYNTNSVTGEKWVGGVVGQNTNNSTVEECHNDGEVSGSGGSEYVGGVVGQNSFSSTVQNCYNTESVSGSGNSKYVGGVVGYNSLTVQNCYNTESVSGHTNVGGIVGYNTSGAEVKFCYNIGLVTNGENNYVGGVAGNYVSGAVKNCYYLEGMSYKGLGDNTTGRANDSIDGAWHLPAAEFGKRINYNEWDDFDDIWEIKDGYPKLKQSTETDTATASYSLAPEQELEIALPDGRKYLDEFVVPEEYEASEVPTEPK